MRERYGYLLQSQSMTNVDLRSQAGKLKFFSTHPNWAVSYIAYTKFHLPRPVLHSPGHIFTRIGEQASASFPARFYHCHQCHDKSDCHIAYMLKHDLLKTNWLGKVPQSKRKSILVLFPLSISKKNSLVWHYHWNIIIIDIQHWIRKCLTAVQPWKCTQL